VETRRLEHPDGRTTTAPVHGNRDVQHNAHSGAKPISRPKIS
jgi:hypothetical protein